MTPGPAGAAPVAGRTAPAAGNRRSPLGRRRRPRIAVLVAALVATLGFGVGAAGAHAVVVATTPAPGALLGSAPERVSIEYSEPVQVGPDSLQVIDETGAVVSGEPQGDGTTVSAELPASATGWHAVSWRAVSADGHPISGAWTFRIGEGAAAPPDELADRAEAAVRTSGGARWTWLAAQGLSTLATVVLVGTTFLSVVLAAGQRTGRRLAVGAGGVALVASLWASAANGPFSTPGPVLDSVFTGPASGAYLLRAALATVAAVAAAVLPARHRPWAALGWMVGLGALVAPPLLTGHAAGDGGVAALVVAAHLIVAACWLGAVPALVLAVRDPGTPAGEVAGRFSVAAGRLLAATVVLGVAGAALLTGGLDRTAATWGGLLVLKLALVAVAVGAAAWNRWRVLPAGADDRATAVRLRRPLAVEAVALVAVVVVSVALTHNGPPTRPADTGPAVVDLQVTEEVRVQVVVDPAETGTNWVHVYTLDETGLPVEVEDVSLTAASPALGIEPIPLALSDVGGGHLLGIVEDFGLAGAWEVTATVRVDQFEEADASSTITIQP